MARNLNEVVGADDAGFVGPLLNNDKFRKGADAQLAAADDKERQAAQAAATHEDFLSTVRMFAGVKRGLAAVAKRFPEASRYTDEAAKQVDMAMQAVVGQDPAAKSPFLTAPASAGGR